ncbi:MAG: hypothetical protein PHU33_17940, partial [Bacteroidales bacterium]|nr:hypothetical protein [Bacteroidales bacterium]
MKKIIVLLVLLFSCIMMYSQEYQLIWQNCFGGSKLDGAYDIVSLPSGYLIAGGTGSNDGDVSVSYGNGDGWLIRVDSTGNLLWEKTYGGSDSEGFSRIIPTTDNNFYLLGISWSSDGDISYDPYPGSPDYWIVKIDSSGNILWDKIVGGTQGESLSTGDATLDGGIVVIGHTYSSDGDVSVRYGWADTWAVKLSSEGELEWDYTIGTDWIDKGQAILATSDGGYLIASTSIILEGGIGNISCFPHTYGWSDGMIFKLDSNLNIQWQKSYGGSDHDGIIALIEVSDGYVFSACVHSNDGDISGWHEGYNHLGGSESDIWVVKIDFHGNIIWQKCLGGSRSEDALNLFQTSNAGFIVIGSTRSNNGDVTGNHSMSEYDDDIWVARLNNEGELLSQHCFGGAGSEMIEFGAVKKSDYNFVIACNTNYGPSYDVDCTPYGGITVDKDIWLFELKDCTHYAPLTPSQPTGPTHACSASGEPARYTVPSLANQTHAW